MIKTILKIAKELLINFNIIKMNKFEFVDAIASIVKGSNTTVSLLNDEIILIKYETENNYNISIQKKLNNDINYFNEFAILKNLLKDLHIIK